ncbi:hypothetical protein JXA59_03070 [Patescibacteria group bacterium]|nr:hypothetical protein [Patescibacteria group bacterium]
MKKLLAELRQLQLPEGEYVVFGSGPMGIRGIRDCGDLDLLITDWLWDQLVADGHQPIVKNFDMTDADGQSVHVHQEQLQIGNIELGRRFNIERTREEIMNDPDMFEGIPFAKLAYVLEWKRNFNRPKDKADVKLIEEYLSKQ